MKYQPCARCIHRDPVNNLCKDGRSQKYAARIEGCASQTPPEVKEKP